MRLRLVLAYNGSAWQGWQLQKAPAPTIQGALEQAIFKLTGENCRVFGAGRTDSGVHALGQTAHVDVPERLWDWRRRLAAVLPPDISVLEAREVDQGFHARKSAVAKTYFYNFWRESAFIDPRHAPFAWSCGPLDLHAMREAANVFLGEHDFSSFQNSGTPVKSTIRVVHTIRITEAPADGFLPCHLPLARFEVCGNGFLKQMVRNMAGFLAAAGNGKASARELENILAARSRKALPTPTAPPHGLFLAKVHYGDPGNA